MITCKIENNKLIIEGEMKQGEKVNGLCCKGFDWEVSTIFPDNDPDCILIYGFCYNPDNCPNYDEHPLFDGVSSIEQLELALYLVEKETAVKEFEGI